MLVQSGHVLAPAVHDCEAEPSANPTSQCQYRWQMCWTWDFANDGLKSHLVPAVKYGLEKMNEEVAAWMLGLITEDGTKSRPPFLAMGSSQSVMWNRDFGQERFKNLQQRWKACMDVEGMLKLLGARQLIIGHTPQVVLHSLFLSISALASLVPWWLSGMLICGFSTCSCKEVVIPPT